MFQAEENVINCHKQISPAQETLLLKYAVWSVLRQNLLSNVVTVVWHICNCFQCIHVLPPEILMVFSLWTQKRTAWPNENWNHKRIVQTLDFEKIALYSGKFHLQLEKIMKLLLSTEWTSNCSKQWSKNKNWKSFYPVFKNRFWVLFLNSSFQKLCTSTGGWTRA